MRYTNVIHNSFPLPWDWREVIIAIVKSTIKNAAFRLGEKFDELVTMLVGAFINDCSFWNAITVVYQWTNARVKISQNNHIITVTLQVHLCQEMRKKGLCVTSTCRIFRWKITWKYHKITVRFFMNKFYSKDSIDRLVYHRNIVRITNPLFNQNTYTPWRLWAITMYVTPFISYPRVRIYFYNVLSWQMRFTDRVNISVYTAH